MTDEAQPIEYRGVAVLMALGEDAGPAAPTHIESDAGAIFAAFAGAGHYSHVAAVYEEAHRQSRVSLAPLSLCLWSESRVQVLASQDDDLTSAAWIGDIPGFALDQYTRPGLAAIRQFAYSNPAWREFAERWRLPRSDWPRAVGELLFRAEGAVVTNRRTWEVGQRLYARSLQVGCFMPEAAVPDGWALILREGVNINQLRARTLSTS